MTDPSSPGHLDTLRMSLAALIEESESLRTDVHTAEQARRRNAQVNLGVLGLLLLFIVMLVMITWQTNRLAYEVRNTNRQVADCTTAGGRCYEDGKQRTGSAVGDILRADIYVSECARLKPKESGPAYDRFLETCVAQKLSTISPSPSSSQSTHPAPSPS